MKNGRNAKWIGRSFAGALALAMILHALFALPLGTVHAEPSSGTEAGAAEIPPDVAKFPESYRAALMSLKEKHPNWQFEPLLTGADWATAVSKEMKDGKSLIEKSHPAYVREGEYGQGSWYFASREVLEHFMDPRNGLTEKAIFQFEHLTFHEEAHTLEALESFLEGTFMKSSKKVPNTSMTYAYLIYMIGAHPDVQVSPFHLASRILQEQGQGNSALISGTYPRYEGYYNYFNIGATGTTDKQVIESGLEYAKGKWGKQLGDDPEQGAYNALWGGANFVADSYIKKGQDTLYLQKFNVNPNAYYAMYSHQYMQNITAPTAEAKSTWNLYNSEKALENSFVFRIPVYENMPEQACPMPTASTNVVLEIPYEVRAYKVKIDGVDYVCESFYNSKKNQIRLIAKMPDANAKKASLVVRDANGEITWEFYWDLRYEDNHYVVTRTDTPTQEEPVVLTNDVTLELPEGVASSEVWLDGVAFAGTIQDGKLTVTAKDENAKTAVIYLSNASGVPQDMLVWTLAYGEKGYEATYQPEMRGLLSYNGFGIRIRGESGIRVKTGIGVETRKKLLGSGIDGFFLKEYGTIAMINADRERYPMIKGGTKTISGVAYGSLEDGTRMDAIFETVDGRHRFTSVLVGLPPEHYKTDFAFRGYIILEKAGKELIFYSPIVTRNIYNLAQIVLELQYYEAGSEVDRFLRKLICDADGIEFNEEQMEHENISEEGSQTEPGNAGEEGSQTEPGNAGEESGQTEPGSTGEEGGQTEPGSTGEEGGQTESGSTGEEGGQTEPGNTGEEGSQTEPGNTGEEGGQTNSENQSESGSQETTGRTESQEADEQEQTGEQGKTDEG